MLRRSARAAAGGAGLSRNSRILGPPARSALRDFMRSSVTAAALGLAAALCVPSIVSGQSKGKAYDPPRLSDGKPDLNGIWNGPVAANNDIQTAKVNGKIPYLPTAAAQLKKNAADRKQLDPMNHCFIPGVPRLMYIPDPFMIVETPGFVAILSQFMHEVRNIPLDGSKHLENIDFWMGDARGSWDGDTLVVDNIDFNDKTWFDAAGNFHSDQLHVVERFTRTGPDHIRYEATIEDPQVFTRPWKISMTLYRRQEKPLRL